jgi:DNA-binding NarL/FixJ family response regulator
MVPAYEDNRAAYRLDHRDRGEKFTRVKSGSGDDAPCDDALSTACLSRPSSNRPSSVPAVWHVSEPPIDLAGREAVEPSLDVVARTLAPHVATFFTVGGDGEIESSVVHGAHLPPAELVEEVRGWKVALRGIDPLAPSKLGDAPGRIATLGDLDEAARKAYEQLGVIGDVRLLVGDAGRVVAGVTLWRPFGSSPWTSAQLRRLEALQPLIELAYLSCLHAASGFEARLPASLTGRQRQVARLLAAGASNLEIARALYVTPHTAKSHARAVLSKLGLASRREMVMRFMPTPAVSGLSQVGIAAPEGRESAIRLQGDQAARRVLAPVLGWGVERIGATIGGCVFFSLRSELVAEAWGSARAGAQTPDARLTWRVHRSLLPAARTREVIRYMDSETAGSPVVQLDDAQPYPSDDRVGELVAGLGLTAPLLAVLRVQGRTAGLVWLSRDPRAPLDQRESARELRGVHPLLELIHGARLPEGPGRRTAPSDLAELGLTPRELAVARLALEGESNAAIARRLGIRESTVKRHMTAILAKSGVRSRTQLIALLSDLGD